MRRRRESGSAAIEAAVGLPAFMLFVALAGTTITFTPAANFSGTAGFDYTLSDGALTDTGHVTVTVTAVNDGPVAVDDAATTAEDTAATITAASLLANDTDPDGTPTITAVSAATNGTVALAARYTRETLDQLVAAAARSSATLPPA